MNIIIQEFNLKNCNFYFILRNSGPDYKNFQKVIILSVGLFNWQLCVIELKDQIDNSRIVCFSCIALLKSSPYDNCYVE